MKSAEKKPSIKQVLISTLAAAIGVQTRANHEQDFNQTSYMPYIVAGIVFTICFVVGLYFIAKIAISSV